MKNVVQYHMWCVMPHVVERVANMNTYLQWIGIPTFPEIHKGVSHETYDQMCYRAPNRIGVQVVSL